MFHNGRMSLFEVFEKVACFCDIFKRANFPESFTG